MIQYCRTPYRASFALVLAFLVPASAHAQTDQTKEAPLPARPADGIALFGELVSIGPDSLVLRETKYAYAADARPGDDPTPVVTERVIRIPAGTPITSPTQGGPQPGARLIVGASEADGILTAIMISDAAGLTGGTPTDPDVVKAALAKPLANALQEATVSEPSRNAAMPDCLIAANGFTPGADMLTFTGCYGGPSLTARASFSPVKIYSNANPALLVPETFSISVTRFELNLGLAGWNYQFPFKFTAVDPTQVALDSWARQCLAEYGSVEAGVCPLTRPFVPRPTQARNIEVNVIPVDPTPAPIMNGGLGGAIGFEFTVSLAAGCGALRLDPCAFTSLIDFGPFSQFQRASGKAPLGNKMLRGEASSCLAFGGNLVLGFLGVPIGISTLISPFDVLYCLPWELYNQSQPGFTARVSEGGYGKVTDVDGTENPRVTFMGASRALRLTPGPSGSSSIRFQQFDYRLDWLSKVRLDLRSSFVTWFRGPEWNIGLENGMKFVNTISPYIDTCGAGIVQPLDSPGFSGLQPVCIDVPIQQAQFGNAAVSELNPVAVSSDGGTRVRVTGSGFTPTNKTDGSMYPGTGVTRVVLNRLDTNTQQDIVFTIKSNTEIELIMPAHPPSLYVDANGGFDHGTSVALTFYAWGTTFYKNIYYAAQPTIGNLTPLDGDFAPEGTLPTGSEMGGERIAINGQFVGKVTDVYFGDRKADFVECHAGQTSPLCNGAPGGLGLYNTIVAIAPPSTGDTADCPVGQGTRCDHVRVRSACFGNDFAQGRPAPGAYCGTSLAISGALYVRKRKPEITSVTPGGGPPGTTMQVTITGIGFSGYPKVKIANVTSSAICNAPGCPSSSDTTLVVTVPASAVGVSQISVINPCPAARATSSRCGESDPVSFKHLDTPLITSLSPAQGTYAGGTLVTLTGVGLTTATSLTFGGAPLAFTPDPTTPDTKLTFTTPQGYPNLVGGLPAPVSVVVTTSCGTLVTTNATACGSSAPLAYTYQPPAVRLSATLRVAQITGEVARPAPVSATLTDSSTGAPLPNRTISFSVLGVSIGSAVTNASGVAALSAVMPELLTGAYAEQTVARFAGDAVYFGITDVNWLVLTKPEVVAWGRPQYSYYTDVPTLLQGVAAISAGGNHTLALKNDGTVVAWGNVSYDIAPPSGLNGVTAISAGYSHSLALRSNGTVVKWGIGGGTLPVLPAIQQISAGQNLSVAVTTTGSLVAWAVSPSNPGLSNVPTPASDPFIAAAAGSTHALALRQGGTVVAWGDNTYGQSTVPAGLTNVVAVAATRNGSLALRSDGTVVGWGDPQPHTVCPPFPCTVVTESVFKTPADLTGVVAIAASPDGSGGVALKSDKTLVAWFQGSYQSLNAPAGYPAGVESFSVGGDGGSVFYVALRKPRLGTTLTVDPVTGFAGDAVTLRAVLLSGTTGASDRDVSFSLNGVASGTGPKTDAYGVTTKATTIPAVAPGLYPTGVQAVFATPALGLDGSSAAAPLLVRGNQTITFAALSDRDYSAAPFTLNATASSALPVSFAASGVCTVAGDAVTVTGPGACAITASQAGTEVYTPAGSVRRTFTVLRTPQTISFAPLLDTRFGMPPFRADVSATSGLTVVLSSLTPQICSAVGLRITYLAQGICSVAADQPGNANFFPATRVTRTFAITLDAFDLSRLPSQLDPVSGQVVAGSSHSCALTAAGDVQCWGNNAAGQLGDGSTTSRLTPASVPGLGSPAIVIAAGGNHTCALLAGRSVKCWGANTDGELGNSSTNSSSTPVAVSGLSNVVGLAAGDRHTCALTTAGTVKCWGANGSGQLGNNSTTASLSPVDVAGPGGTGVLLSVTAIAAGAAHTCASALSGGVHCWGAGDEGQLGGGSTEVSTTPKAVLGVGGTGLLSGALRVIAGEAHTCALLADGGAKCWGRNSSGQLGDGTTSQQSAPASVAAPADGVVSIAAGANHTCAVTSTDGIRCWGKNAEGQVGDGSTSDRSAPVRASGLDFGMLSVAGGRNHTCALTTSGGVRCWGSNGDGQLGDNSTTSTAVFADVAGLAAGAAKASLNGSHACALTAAGGVKCWGLNDQGQLGDGTTTNRSTPIDVVGLGSGVAAIASGRSHTCALTRGGGVRCWGGNASGALGDGSSSNKLVPTPVVGLDSGAAAIAAGESHTCALMFAGGIKCWGGNAWGQIGDGTTTPRLSPVDLAATVNGVVSLVAGDNHNCILTSGGAVRCWGRNSTGQLGDGTTTGRTTSVEVTGLAAAVLGVAAGADHSCAFLDDGATKCWGSNADGQLGDGSQTQSLVPIALAPQVAGVSALALGGNSSCALGDFGSLTCWGRNVSGQLGDGTTLSRSTASRGVAGSWGAGSVSAGPEDNCAVTGAGGLKCWGKGDAGQIGDGSTTDRLTAVDVRGGQAIYFTVPSVLEPLQQLPLQALATSGLTPEVESLTPGLCTVTGATATAVSAGLCVVRARQDGNGSFAAAPPQLRLISVVGPISLSQAQVPENSPAGTEVGTLSLGAASFALASGTGDTDNAAFAIANGKQLVTAAVFNFEAKSSYSIRVRATEGPVVLERAFTITIQDQNESPTVANAIPDQDATEGSGFAFTFAANAFADSDAGNAFTYSTGTLPSWLTFTPATRTFSGTPGDTAVGFVDILVTATDNGSPSTASVGDTFRITVGGVNAMPSFVVGGNRSHPFATVTAQSFSDGASDIRDGDPEVTQSLTFNVSAETNAVPTAVAPLVGGSPSSAFETDGEFALPAFGWTNLTGTGRILDLAGNGALVGTTPFENYGAQIVTMPVEANATYTLQAQMGFATDTPGGTADYALELGTLTGAGFSSLGQRTGSVAYLGNLAAGVVSGRATLTVSTGAVSPGELLVVRWRQLSSSGASDSFGVDAVTLSMTHNLFATPPSITQNGTLTYTPLGIAGSATVTVTLTDDSTAGGAALTTEPQTFKITIRPEAPEAVTGAASGIGQTGATLNGTVNPHGTATTAAFSYGTTTEYGQSISPADPGSVSSQVAVSSTLTGLTCSTNYHYQLVATNAGGTAQGSDVSFTTSACSTAPVLGSTGAASVTASGAEFNGSVTSDGGSSITERGIVYSLTTTNGNPLIGGSGVTKSAVTGTTGLFTVGVTGLQAGSGYSFRAFATNAVGTTYSGVTNITTLILPSATTGAAGSVTQTSAQLSGVVNANGTSTTARFAYGSTLSYGGLVVAGPTPGSGNSSVNVGAQVTGLSCGTTYNFRLTATSAAGTTSGSNATFTTLPCGPTIASFTASNPIVPSLGASTLSWSATPGATLTLNGASVAGPTGSQVVHPSATTAYELVATTEAGSAGRTVTVHVDDGTLGLGTPSVTAPSPGQAVIVTGVGFSWTGVAAATGYDIRVYDRATGATMFSGSLVGGASTTALVTLEAGGYRFAVRACAGGFDATHCGPLATRDFSVAPAAPGEAPSVTFPAEGASLSTSTQTLQWTSVAPNPALGGMSYEVLLRNITAGTTTLQIAVPSPATSTIFTMGSSAQYELKVRACQAGCGPWSTPVNFSVTLPTVPASAPAISSCTASGNSLTCQWGAVTNADTYQVLVVQPSGGPGGGALTVAAVQVSATTVTLPVPAGAAAVLIAACNGDGCGPNAQTSINVGGQNPSAPNLGTPMAGTVVNGPTVLFTWNRIPTDNGSNTKYRLYVQDLSRQSAALDVFTTQNFYAAYFKAEGARYDGLVIANPGLPGQVQGAASGFNVAGSSATAPTMVSPAHNSTVPAGNIQLGWSPVPGATLYEYFVAIQGQPDASARGVTQGLLAQVPLSGSAAGTVYSGIVRACPSGFTCAAGVDTNWGPWSNVGGPGVTNFTVIP